MSYLSCMLALVASLLSVSSSNDELERAIAAHEAFDYERAISILDEALRADPKNTEALEWRADSYWQLDRNQEALADLMSSDVGERRAFVRERRQHDADWFCKRFHADR